MVHLIVQGVKYLTILLFLVYTFDCFRVFKNSKNIESQKAIYGTQRVILYLIHLGSYLVLYSSTMDVKLIGFYIVQVIFITAIFVIYKKFYKSCSELVLNNMCMLMTISLIMLTRISFDKGLRQFEFMIVGFCVSIIIPLVLQNVSVFRKYTWIYAVVGIISLAAVLVFGNTEYGAKLSISFGRISVQPSEFVKILLVLYIASMLRERTDFRQLAITSVVSAVFVLVLVASRDLGGALLYFFTYLVMVYVATRKFYIFAGGLGAMSLASIVGYKLFSHVQNRVIAWRDPLSVIDNEGFQVSRSLFAIGTGGWFGFGLNQGKPKLIPVVENDFIFSAISEEMGGVFALCLIMVCVSCFLMMFNIAMQMKDNFYKLVALGLGSTYALQVFLTIGGVTKFIPSTGVTLPLVSYGGSSLLSTMILFGIVQGFYISKGVDSLNGGQKTKKKTR